MKETRNSPQILESGLLEGQKANRRTMLKSIFWEKRANGRNSMADIEILAI